MVERHARWAMMRRRLCPAAFYLEPLTNPLLLLPLAIAALGNLAFVWLLATWFIRDVLSTVALSKRIAPQAEGGIGWALIVSPLRDLAMMVAWSSALFARHVSWRGTRLRVGRSTTLSPVSSNRRVTQSRVQV
jgi:ceramide glucosyltransferase